MRIFTVFLKNRNFISKIKRSKTTDYAALRNNSIGLGFIYNFKDPIHLYNFKSEYYIALQFYIKTSKVIEPRSDKRDLLTIKVKSEISTEKE